MLTTEECPEMNVGTGKFSDDVEMTSKDLHLYVSVRVCVLLPAVGLCH